MKNITQVFKLIIKKYLKIFLLLLLFISIVLISLFEINSNTLFTTKTTNEFNKNNDYGNNSFFNENYLNLLEKHSELFPSGQGINCNQSFLEPESEGSPTYVYNYLDYISTVQEYISYGYDLGLVVRNYRQSKTDSTFIDSSITTPFKVNNSYELLMNNFQDLTPDPNDTSAEISIQPKSYDGRTSVSFSDNSTSQNSLVNDPQDFSKQQTGWIWNIFIAGEYTYFILEGFNSYYSTATPTPQPGIEALFIKYKTADLVWEQLGDTTPVFSEQYEQLKKYSLLLSDPNLNTDPIDFIDKTVWNDIQNNLYPDTDYYLVKNLNIDRSLFVKKINPNSVKLPFSKSFYENTYEFESQQNHNFINTYYTKPWFIDENSIVNNFVTKNTQEFYAPQPFIINSSDSGGDDFLSANYNLIMSNPKNFYFPSGNPLNYYPNKQQVTFGYVVFSLFVVTIVLGGIAIFLLFYYRRINILEVISRKNFEIKLIAKKPKIFFVKKREKYYLLKNKIISKKFLINSKKINDINKIFKKNKFKKK